MPLVCECKNPGVLIVPSIFKNLNRKKKYEADSQSIDNVVSALQKPGNSDISPNTAAQGSVDLSRRAHPSVETQQVIVGVAQSSGIQRDNNEDALFTLTTNVLSNGHTIKFGLYIIADGMGGHENGELASNLAIEILSEYVIKSIYLPLISVNNTQPERSLQEVMRDGVLMAHQAIKHAAQGGGTTLTALLIMGSNATLAHVGDSRAYILSPDGILTLLTHDHSLVKRMEEIGQLSHEEASAHPRRNLLYRAVGQGDTLDPDITSFPLMPDSSVMLCTDGLWGEIEENAMLGMLGLSAEPHLICQALVDAANAAGGPDNISVIMIRFIG